MSFVLLRRETHLSRVVSVRMCGRLRMPHLLHPLLMSLTACCTGRAPALLVPATIVRLGARPHMVLQVHTQACACYCVFRFISCPRMLLRPSLQLRACRWGPDLHLQYQIYFCNIQMKYMQHLDEHTCEKT
jgi:hypothetical protein